MVGLYGLTFLVLFVEAPYRRGESSIVIQPEVAPMAVLYILFAATICYSGLRSAHLAMEKARNELVLNIADQYKNKINSLGSSLMCADFDQVKERIEELEQLNKVHVIASTYPTWPIDTKNVIRFCASYLAPVILALIIKLLS